MDLANALREERKSAELQHLDKDFYQQVGIYLSGLSQELSSLQDPFSVEAQILQDTLKSEKNSVNKLIAVSYTHLRAHETPEHLVCRILLEKKKHKTQHKTNTTQSYNQPQ